MSYSIRYAPEKETCLINKKHRLGLIGVIVTVLVCAAAVGCALPAQVQQLRQVFLPWSEPVVQEAFAEFREDVRSGVSFREAAVDFCREILDNAKNAA